MNSKKVNKALSIGLCAAVLVPGIVSAKEFKDVKSNGEYGWAYEYIDVLSDQGVIDGYPNGNYEPANSVSLEETFQLLKGIINPSSTELRDAVTKYGSVCDQKGVSSWAREAVSLALARGIVSESDLQQAGDKDLIGPNKTKYPDRNTVSVYYAKGLNLSAKGDESLLRHSDKDNIPVVTKGYLASLVKVGIFSPTGSDGVFEGNRPIRRSEMAKITKLSNDYAKATGLDLEEKTIEGKVILATNLNNIDTIITEKDSKRSQFKVDSNTVYKQGDKTVTFKDIKPEQEVKITYAKNGDETITGLAKKIEITNSEKKLVGYVTDSSSDNFTVKYKENDKDVDLTTTDKIKTTDNAKFKLAKDAKIYKYGKKISERDLKSNDLIEFKTNSTGEVIEAFVYPEKGEVTGKITDIDQGTSSRKESITLKLDDGNKYTFYSRKSAGSSSREFRDLKEDKEVTLQLEYKVVKEIGKAKKSDYIVGEITEAEEYDRADGRDIGYIRVKTSEGRTKYFLTKDTEFKDDTSNAKNPQQRIKDLKGETVKLYLDGEKVETLTKIDKRKAIDAVAQIVDIETDRHFDEKVYTIRILNVGYGNVSVRDEFKFSTSNSFDKWEIIRITGQKSGGDLEDITIQHVKYKDEKLNSYDYDYKKDSNNDDNYNIKWK